MLQNLSSGQRLAIIGIVGFVIGFALAYLWLVSPKQAEEKVTTTDKPNVAITNSPVNEAESNAAIQVQNQEPGMVVRIDSVTLVRAGWVAIHEDRDGQPGNILGAAYFPEGTQSGEVELLRNTVVGGVYYAMLHEDDGIRAFDHKTDLPVVGEDGKPIMTRFTTDD